MTILLKLVIALWTVMDVGCEESRNQIEDICNHETFQPKCLKNEVILMQSATYGRMRIGRCVTADEIHALLQKATFEDATGYIGCSADVLPILDRKCSGHKNCDVRLSDISAENIKPCLPGLIVYLEVSYSCINVVDEERSCTASVSNNNPIHIIGSSSSQRICGTTSQPWNVEAPLGQRIKIFLLNFATSAIPQIEAHGEQPCKKYGTILDKIGKRNTTICGDIMQREMKIYSSTGNSIDMQLIFKPSEQLQTDHVRQFVMKLEAIGCSDIIPPEDSWLKRNKDSIQIGCYSSRQTWHLNCQDRKWIGVVGNCSQSEHGIAELTPRDTTWKMESDRPIKFSDTELVLAIVAIVGFTVAICIAVICVGAICLRRFNRKGKRREEYKTLNYPINTVRSDQQLDTRANGNELHGLGVQQMPLYSVYDGDSEFNVVNNTSQL